MNRLDERTRDLVARAEAEAVERTAAAVRDAVPDARVVTEPGRIVVEARGLARRWVLSTALRWLRGLFR